MSRILLVLTTLLIATMSYAQQAAADSSYLIRFNQQIDLDVVHRNISSLDTMFASDFVFSHGSGNVQGKEGWLKSVEKNNYPARQHDSVTVELHPGLAVVKGNMAIQRVDKDKTALYRLKYLRVYAIRNNRWRLISHTTTKEVHDN